MIENVIVVEQKMTKSGVLSTFGTTSKSCLRCSHRALVVLCRVVARRSLLAALSESQDAVPNLDKTPEMVIFRSTTMTTPIIAFTTAIQTQLSQLYN